jgi:hypothetical protein
MLFKRPGPAYNIKHTVKKKKATVKRKTGLQLTKTVTHEKNQVQKEGVDWRS